MAFTVSLDVKNYQHILGAVAQHPLAQASASFVASSLLIIALFSLAIRPTILTVDTLKDQITLLTDLNGQLITKHRLLQQLLPHYQRLVPLTPQIDAVLPTNHDFLLFERQLRFLVQAHDLRLQTVTFGPVVLRGDQTMPLTEPTPIAATPETTQTTEATNPAAPYTTFSLSVWGSYVNLKSFVRNLQLLDRLVTLDQVTFQAQEPDSSTLVPEPIGVTLEGKSYYYLVNPVSTAGILP